VTKHCGESNSNVVFLPCLATYLKASGLPPVVAEDGGELMIQLSNLQRVVIGQDGV
jgi:hypothetical protein